MDVKKLIGEAIGTFWLTFGGCGSAVIAAAFPHVGIGLVGVSLAFGLSAPDFTVSGGFAANGYGEHSLGHYDLLSCCN